MTRFIMDSLYNDPLIQMSRAFTRRMEKKSTLQAIVHYPCVDVREDRDRYTMPTFAIREGR